MATKTKQPEKKAGSAPVMTWRRRGIKLAVFENTAESGSVFYKTTIQKIYKEGAEFKTTSSFGRDDLPVVQHLLKQAWIWILDAEDVAKATANQPAQEESA